MASAQEALASGKTTLDEKWNQLQAGKSQLDAAKSSLDAAASRLSEAASAIAYGKSQLAAGQNQITQKEFDFDQQLNKNMRINKPNLIPPKLTIILGRPSMMQQKKKLVATSKS